YAAVVLLCASVVQASLTNSSWFARSWQTDNGLPHNAVTGVAQTPEGFLWMATPVGLARFDGVRFEELSLTNYVMEPSRGIVTLAQSRSGGLLLAMDRGQILELNYGSSRVFTKTNGLPDRTVETLTEDGEGSVWVAYREG